jgi:hypothetical protein
MVHRRPKPNRETNCKPKRKPETDPKPNRKPHADSNRDARVSDRYAVVDVI